MLVTVVVVSVFSFLLSSLFLSHRYLEAQQRSGARPASNNRFNGADDAAEEWGERETAFEVDDEAWPVSQLAKKGGMLSRVVVHKQLQNK